MKQAELDWTDRVIDELASGRLDWPALDAKDTL
jgi:hypothetical protein